jgi:hypothetical protein
MTGDSHIGGEPIRRRVWDPQPGDEELIRQHLERQRDLDITLFVRLDDDRVVRVGLDAEGEE